VLKGYDYGIIFHYWKPKYCSYVKSHNLANLVTYFTYIQLTNDVLSIRLDVYVHTSLVFVRLAKDLLDEAQMYKLHHQNIIMLIAVTFEHDHYGVVFEYVTYGGLDNFLENYQVKLHSVR